MPNDTTAIFIKLNNDHPGLFRLRYSEQSLFTGELIQKTVLSTAFPAPGKHELSDADIYDGKDSLWPAGSLMVYDVMKLVNRDSFTLGLNGVPECIEHRSSESCWQACRDKDEYASRLLQIATEYDRWYNDMLTHVSLGKGVDPYITPYEVNPQEKPMNKSKTSVIKKSRSKYSLAKKYMAYGDSVKNKSYYAITFEFDLCDADYTTSSSDTIYGVPDNDELIKLAVAARYNELSAYDGEWFNLGKLQKFLEEYVGCGVFHDCYNRFKVENITIHGYDAKKKAGYTISPAEIDLDELGIKYDDDKYIDVIDYLYDEYFDD